MNEEIKDIITNLESYESVELRDLMLCIKEELTKRFEQTFPKRRKK